MQGLLVLYLARLEAGLRSSLDERTYLSIVSGVLRLVGVFLSSRVRLDCFCVLLFALPSLLIAVFGADGASATLTEISEAEMVAQFSSSSVIVACKVVCGTAFSCSLVIRIMFSYMA